MVVAPVHGGDEEQLLENVRRLSIFLPAKTNVVKLRNLYYYIFVKLRPPFFLDFFLKVSVRER